MFHVASAEAVRGLQQTEADAFAAIRQALGQSAAYAQSLAKSSPAFKDHTHALRESIRRGERGPWSLFVQAGSRQAPYALFVEEDTKAHEIRPKLGGSFVGPARPGQGRRRGEAAPLIRFMIAGRWISKHMVKHPGTTGKHFMGQARDRAEEALVRFVETGLNSVFG